MPASSPSASTSITYTGLGQPGVWADPKNWSGGIVPGAGSTAIIPTSDTLNGSITVANLMLLGAETITVNGHITTLNANTCQSFMACEGAVVNFTAGSSLTDAGGFITGLDAGASITVSGASGTQAAANLSVGNIKLGQQDDGSGTLTITGGTVTAQASAFVGDEGQGTLSVTNGGHANFGGMIVGRQTGGAGIVTIAAGGVVNVAGQSFIGNSALGAPGGTGVAVLSAGGTLNSDAGVYVNAGSAVHMQGGTLICGPDERGLQINQMGSVTGAGSVVSAQKGVTDNGTLAAAGGTLAVTGNLTGMGAVQIGANSTLDLVASKITVPTISFLGANATLELVTGVSGSFTIAGFGAGDHLMMAGIDAASWNGASNTLTLSEHGQVLERLVFSGLPAQESFTVTQGSGGSIISLAASTSGHLALAMHS